MSNSVKVLSKREQKLPEKCWGSVEMPSGLLATKSWLCSPDGSWRRGGNFLMSLEFGLSIRGPDYFVTRRLGFLEMLGFRTKTVRALTRLEAVLTVAWVLQGDPFTVIWELCWGARRSRVGAAAEHTNENSLDRVLPWALRPDTFLILSCFFSSLQQRPDKSWCWQSRSVTLSAYQYHHWQKSRFVRLVRPPLLSTIHVNSRTSPRAEKDSCAKLEPLCLTSQSHCCTNGRLNLQKHCKKL